MRDEGTKSQKDLSEIDKTILTGRIYPAIQCCVKNRYYILLGIFAYYGFILNSTNEEFMNWIINLIVSGIFTSMVIHNFINYKENTKEQYKIENKYLEDKDKKTLQKRPTMETFFLVISLLIIWGAYLLFFTKQIWESVKIYILNCDF